MLLFIISSPYASLTTPAFSCNSALQRSTPGPALALSQTIFRRNWISIKFGINHLGVSESHELPRCSQGLLLDAYMDRRTRQAVPYGKFPHFIRIPGRAPTLVQHPSFQLRKG